MRRFIDLILVLPVLAVLACSGGNNGASAGNGSGNNLDVVFRYADGTPFDGGTWWTQNGALVQTSALALTDPFTGVRCDDVPSSVDPTTYGCIDSDGHGFVPNHCTDTGPDSTETYTVYVMDSNGNVGTTEISCAAVGNGDDDVGGTSDVDDSQPVSGIVLYQTTATTDGNIGGRAGADAMCVAAKPSGLTQTDVRAFIGVGTGDDVQNLPGNYGVPTNVAFHGSDGTEIASNWSDLFDGNIAVSLNSAGISASTYWSGSLDDATSPGDNCNGWTNNTPGGGFLSVALIFSGAIGDGSATSGGWLGVAPEDCSLSHVILCIAFDPVTITAN